MGAEVTPRWVCAVALAALIGTSGLADAAAAQSRLEPTASDYGGVGLMQTRTARFHDDGDLSVGYFHGFPWTRFMVNFQALPWLEVTARYGDFNSGTSSTLADRDRSVDAKILLWPESDLLPQVAVGFQDFMGTGHYSGEYLVASKRWFDLDFTFGVGWGRLGSRGDLDNPLSLLSKRFDRRSDSGGGGGLLSLEWFQGRDIAIFGGIEYHTPIDGLSLKLELSGDDMPLERNNPEFSLESRLNVGASYRISDWADLGVSFENGNTVMLRGLVGLNLGKKPMPIVIDQPPPAVKPRVEQSGPRPIGTVRAEARNASGASQPAAPPRHEADRADEQAALALIAALREARLPPLAAEVRTREATAIVAHERYRHLTKLIGRVARVMTTVLPPTVERFTIAVWTGGSRYRGWLSSAVTSNGPPRTAAARKRPGCTPRSCRPKEVCRPPSSMPAPTRDSPGGWNPSSGNNSWIRRTRSDTSCGPRYRGMSNFSAVSASPARSGNLSTATWTRSRQRLRATFRTCGPTSPNISRKGAKASSGFKPIISSIWRRIGTDVCLEDCSSRCSGASAARCSTGRKVADGLWGWN